MIVTAWQNGSAGSSGAGYGLKVAAADRDLYFQRSWQTVRIAVPDGHEVSVYVAKRSFWGPTCRELISAHIGRWMLKEGLAPWVTGKPPKLELEPAGENRFLLHKR